MKFKYIFILFNAIIVIFVATILVLSFTMPEQDFILVFLRSVWPPLLLLALMLIILNIYYYSNRRLFSLLEREDWPALVQYLESEVLRKGRYTRRLVQLLANTYLLLSDSRSVTSLENKTAVVKPAIVEENALIFGAARLLSADIGGAVNFFEAHLKKAKGAQAQWVLFYYGFALLLDRRFSEAADQFVILCSEARDAAVSGLSAFFLSETVSAFLPSRKEELLLASEKGRQRVLGAFPGSVKWERELSRLRTEIHCVILTLYFKKASAWLYPNTAA